MVLPNTSMILPWYSHDTPMILPNTSMVLPSYSQVLPLYFWEYRSRWSIAFPPLNSTQNCLKNLTLIEQKKNVRTLFLHHHWFIYIILLLITISLSFCFHNFIFNQLISFFSFHFFSFLCIIFKLMCVRACSYISGDIEFFLRSRLYSQKNKWWITQNKQQIIMFEWTHWILNITKMRKYI